MSTIPIYQLFDMIAQSAVGNVGNSSLIYLQLFLSLFIEIKFLFSSMKNRPPLMQFSIAMIPMVLIATYSIACGLIFSAFLGNGPTLPKMAALVNVTLSRQCVLEMLIVAAAFFVLTLIYSIAYRLNPLQWLMTFGIELLAALSLLTLYGGLLIPDFPYTILDLCAKNIYLARWPIYGYFTLLFKCLVLMVSLLLGLALHERKAKPEDEEEKYRDRAGYYEKKALRYLTKGDALTGFFCVLFSAAAGTLILWGMIDENVWNLDTIFTAMMVSVIILAPAAFGVCLFYHALHPRTGKAYRQLLAMGDKNTILQLFCEEIVDRNLPEVNLWTTNVPIQTAHFRLWRQSIRSRVEWRGERL